MLHGFARPFLIVLSVYIPKYLRSVFLPLPMEVVDGYGPVLNRPHVVEPIEPDAGCVARLRGTASCPFPQGLKTKMSNAMLL